jgi:ribose 1,5-bisphosphokinase
MKGGWVFVCGASGAGKDSVMSWAESHLSGQKEIVFSRRWVTRPSTVGSDHDEISVDQFNDLANSGGLVWQWRAHGFDYGIDRHYARLVEAGQIVVVNGSREHAQSLECYESIRVVQIEVSPKALEARLINRGRETSEMIVERMARNQLFPELKVHHRVVNDGELAASGKAFADYLTLCSFKPSSKSE